VRCNQPVVDPDLELVLTGKRTTRIEAFTKEEMSSKTIKNTPMQIHIEASASDHAHLLDMAQPNLARQVKRCISSFFTTRGCWCTFLQQLILLPLLGIYLQTEAQVQTSRRDFEEEGFGVMSPMNGVTVKGKHFFERYEPLYEGSPVKLINYCADFSYKKSSETELMFIQGVKATMKDDPKLSIREDLSDIQLNRNKHPYRSLKLTKGIVNIDHFFFFRKDQVVLLRFEYKSSNQDYLSDVVASAVRQFLWLEPKTVLMVPEMGARITLPGEFKGVLNKTKTTLLLSLPDSTLTRYYRFRGSIEYLGAAGTYDTAKIKAAMRKEISALPSSRLVYETGLMNYQPDYLIEQFKIKGVEKGLQMEQYMCLISTGN
jgi:hypothetical protein